MFANRTNLSRPAILTLAGKVGLDLKRFTADLDSDKTRLTVARDEADGDKAGVEGTPTVFINGQRYNGSLELEPMRKVIDGKLKELAKK